MSIKDYLLKFKYVLITCLLLIGSLLINVFAIRSCSNYKDSSIHNIIALTDTISYYESKTGELVASKTLLEGDMKILKLANDSLYNIVKNMKLSNPTTVVYVGGEIHNEPQDTVWRTDTLINNLNIRKEFAFNNPYRSLEGYVSANDSTIGLNIEKDLIYFDYTVAVENSKVFIKSSNPYVKYNEITGITLPSPKKKHWSLGIGPHIGYGYDFQNKHFNPYVGIGLSINYNILSW